MLLVVLAEVYISYSQRLADVMEPVNKQWMKIQKKAFIDGKDG
jgi:hypothetical protein